MDDEEIRKRLTTLETKLDHLIDLVEGLTNTTQTIDSNIEYMSKTTEALEQYVPFVGKLENLCYYVNPLNFFGKQLKDGQNSNRGRLESDSK